MAPHASPTGIQLHPLPYCGDSEIYFRRIQTWAYPVWLDSGRPHGDFGRYDILSAEPRSRVESRGGETFIHGADGSRLQHSDPFDAVSQVLADWDTVVDDRVPFTGGAIGFFGYNLRHAAEPRLPWRAQRISVPDMLVGFYDWAIIQDHERQTAMLMVCDSAPADAAERLLTHLAPASGDQYTNDKSFYINNLKPDIDANSYHNAIERIQAYILAGDCYQVNFAQRFAAGYQGNPFTAYQHLRRQLPGPFSGFMSFPQGALLCHSPERFLALDNGQVWTQPIKGTINRGQDAASDRANAQQLQASTKDRAENLMIVDLLRNDLSKVCELDTVTVPYLCQLQSYANVHHLVSEVRGKLQTGADPLALLKACFPGGSITGAPKVRAMEIIDELEPADRSLYCGSLGYISSNGQMDTNITIRSLVCDRDRIYCWGGGGIVADSDPAAEYRESLHKINVLLEGLRHFQR